MDAPSCGGGVLEQSDVLSVVGACGEARVDDVACAVHQRLGGPDGGAADGLEAAGVDDGEFHGSGDAVVYVVPVEDAGGEVKAGAG